MEEQDPPRQPTDWRRNLDARLAAAEAQQDWTQVEALCRQGLQDDSDDWSLWHLLGRSLEQRQNWDQAETLWRHLCQRFCERPDPFLALAALQRRKGLPEAARIVLQQAQQQLGPSPDLSRSLGVIDDPWMTPRRRAPLTPQSPAADVAAMLQAANEHLDLGRAPEAEAAFVELIRARPESLPIHRSLAALRHRRGAHALMIEQLTPLLASPMQHARLEPPDLLHRLVESLLHLERWAVLEPLLADLRPARPDDSVLACAHARLLLVRGLENEALAVLRQVLVQRSGDAPALALLGETLARLGDGAAAIEAFSQALAVDPHLEGVAAQLEQSRRAHLWSQGETALHQARWAEAAQAFQRLLDRNPGDQQALVRLDLLARLDPANWNPAHGVGNVGADPRSSRLAEFAAVLDRLEARIQAHAHPLS
jgi:tetratricopeptide (TPR) repeat protein